MKLVDTKYIFVNIADTEHISYGDFRIPLPQFQTGTGVYNHMYIKKHVIPYDWKAFNSGNNTLTITVNTTVHTYTLTEGNPNVMDLVAEINSLQTYVTASFNRTSSKISWKNNTVSTVYISAGAYKKIGLNASALTVATATTVASPNIVDVAPARILIIKSELPSSGEEVYISSSVTGETRDTGIVSAICMDVPPYSHKVWRDMGGFYYSYIQKTTQSVRFWFEDVDGNKIVPQTPPFLVVAVETYKDDSGELLSTQQEALRLQKFALLVKGQKSKGEQNKNVKKK